MRSLGVLAVVLVSACAALAQHAPSRTAPWEGLRVEDGAVRAKVDGAWYRLVEIEGVSIGRVAAWAELQFGDDATMRMVEDITDVMEGLGRRLPMDVDLRVIDESGNERLLENVRMSREARQRAKALHANEEWGRLVDAELALRSLAGVIESQCSYASLRVDDWDALADELIGEIGAQASERAVYIAAVRMVAATGDGHARLRPGSALSQVNGRGFLPFLMEETGGGVVAFDHDRSGFVDGERPYVLAIDGIAIDRWLDEAEAFTVDGSRALVQGRRAAELRNVQLFRDRLGLPRDVPVRVALAKRGGLDPVDREIALRSGWPRYGTWPRVDDACEFEVLDGDIAYLRIASMDNDEDFLRDVRRAMGRACGGDALIIDVRGNGGGSRVPTRLIVPYVMKTDARVINVARKRLGITDGDWEGDLSNRSLYPGTHERWSDCERAAIEDVMQAFEPEWAPTRGVFGPWCFDVVSTDRYGFSGERFGGDVVVLMDGGCFSATDIFLGALKGIEGVTLMGTPSGGGSGRSVEHVVAGTPLGVKLSTMVSYLPDGSLYDGNGIAPDVIVEPTPGYFVGEEDPQLDAAVEFLRSR